jgi:hypothetical protein
MNRHEVEQLIREATGGQVPSTGDTLVRSDKGWNFGPSAGTDPFGWGRAWVATDRILFFEAYGNTSAQSIGWAAVVNDVIPLNPTKFINSREKAEQSTELIVSGALEGIVVLWWYSGPNGTGIRGERLILRAKFISDYIKIESSSWAEANATTRKINIGVTILTGVSSVTIEYNDVSVVVPTVSGSYTINETGPLTFTHKLKQSDGVTDQEWALTHASDVYIKVTAHSLINGGGAILGDDVIFHQQSGSAGIQPVSLGGTGRSSLDAGKLLLGLGTNPVELLGGSAGAIVGWDTALAKWVAKPQSSLGLTPGDVLGIDGSEGWPDPYRLIWWDTNMKVGLAPQPVQPGTMLTWTTEGFQWLPSSGIYAGEGIVTVSHLGGWRISVKPYWGETIGQGHLNFDSQDNSLYVALGTAANHAAPGNHGHFLNDLGGILAAIKGGTGISSYTPLNFIRAATETTLEQRTPLQVRTDIEAAPVNHGHTPEDLVAGYVPANIPVYSMLYWNTSMQFGLTPQPTVPGTVFGWGVNGFEWTTPAGVLAGSGIEITGGNRVHVKRYTGSVLGQGHLNFDNETDALYVALGTAANHAAPGNHSHLLNDLGGTLDASKLGTHTHILPASQITAGKFDPGLFHFNWQPRLGPDTLANAERGYWSPIHTAIGAGVPLASFRDEEFSTGVNGVAVYNNSGGTAVTIIRVDDLSAPNSTGKSLQIANNGGAASPGLGGFVTEYVPRRNGVLVQRFWAKVPVGYTLEMASNAVGTDGTNYWLTSQAGTGKWEEYIRVTAAGSTGTISSSGHVYLTGPAGAVTWHLGSIGVYDITQSGVSWLKFQLDNLSFDANNLNWGTYLLPLASGGTGADLSGIAAGAVVYKSTSMAELRGTAITAGGTAAQPGMLLTWDAAGYPVWAAAPAQNISLAAGTFLQGKTGGSTGASTWLLPESIHGAAGKVLMTSGSTYAYWGDPPSFDGSGYAALTGATFTGNVTVQKTSPELFLNRTDTSGWIGIHFRHNGANRWYWGIEGTAAMPLTLYRYSDAGVYSIGWSLDRLTGAMQVGGAVTATTFYKSA